MIFKFPSLVAACEAWKPTSACDLATPRASKDFPISFSLVCDHLYPHTFLFVCIESGSGKVALPEHQKITTSLNGFISAN